METKDKSLIEIDSVIKKYYELQMKNELEHTYYIMQMIYWFLKDARLWQMSFRLFFEVFAEVEGERVNGRRRNLNVGTNFRWILKKKVLEIGVNHL